MGEDRLTSRSPSQSSRLTESTTRRLPFLNMHPTRRLPFLNMHRSVSLGGGIEWAATASFGGGCRSIRPPRSYTRTCAHIHMHTHTCMGLHHTHTYARTHLYISDRPSHAH
eukprot:GHVU01072054.1.p1 GENE.GHVU01072054.1~~GHVU01072054.1.p1  ORF type:complete len:111 (+),score=5.43 GHVU01072054.1:126-458(+)